VGVDLGEERAAGRQRRRDGPRVDAFVELHLGRLVGAGGREVAGVLRAGGGRAVRGADEAVAVDIDIVVPEREAGGSADPVPVGRDARVDGAGLGGAG
jgi:hypothetical protein